MANESASVKELQAEAATAVFKAIIASAPDANRRGTEGVESLARAYAAVASALPRSGAKVL